jgi:hypothetical protein
MEHLLPSAIVSFASFVLGAYALGARGRRHHRALMRQIAGRLRLEPSHGLKHERLRGAIEGFEVTIESAARIFFLESDATAVSIRSRGRIPKILTLVPIESWRALDHFFEGERILTNDRAFDARVVAQGDELRAAAILDSTARAVAAQAIGGLGANLCLGTIHYETKTPLDTEDDANRIIEAVHALIALAKALAADDSSLPVRLLGNVRSDPHPGVRYRSLSVLLDHFPASAESKTAIQIALTDPSTSSRFLAALNLGQDGFSHLERIALDDAAPERLRGRAIHALVKLEPIERVVDVLERVLETTVWEVKISALEAMAKIGHLPASRAGTLEEMVASRDTKAISAVLELIEATHARSFEQMLIDLIGSSGRGFPAGTIVETAVRLLGDLGTVRSVEPLLDLSKLIFIDPSLKRTARIALGEIQSRLGDVDRGRLSIVRLAEDEGALSLAADEGALSITPGLGPGEVGVTTESSTPVEPVEWPSTDKPGGR